MQLMDVLRQAQDGSAIANLAKAHGVAPADVEAALKGLIPVVGQALERQTLSRGGLADLVSALGHPEARRALDDPAAAAHPDTKQAGIELLEQVFGNKDRSRAMAAYAARSSGLSEVLIKNLLPYLVPMIVGGLAKSSGGSLGNILSKLPGAGGTPAAGRAGSAPAGSGRAVPMPAPAPRAGQGPLPLPGENTPLGGSNPYSDLSDVIRRGGGAAGGSGGLPGVVRSILGSLLGFQSSGLMSWLIRLIVMRWGFGLLRTIFGRALAGGR